MDLDRFAAIVRRWWRLIVVSTGTAVVVVLVLTLILPKQYDAQAKVLVGSLTETSTDQLVAYQQLAQTYAQLAMSTPVLAQVAADLALEVDPVQLAKRVTARAPTGQAIVEVVATAQTAAEAADIASGVALQITKLATPTGVGATSLATVIQPAIPPESPTSPRLALNVALALVLGLAAGLGLALVFDARSTGVTAMEGAATVPAEPSLP